MAKKRNGSFPESVQPGIPKLFETPEGWTREPLGVHLFEVKRPVSMIDDAEYKLVTVKRSRGGAEERNVLKGKDIKVKSQFYVEPNDFLISKRQIVHGACALVPDELDGAIVSNEYAVLGADERLDLDFLKYLSYSVYFQQTCFHSSIGVHVEKMIFKLDRWLRWDFDLPPLAEQKRISRILSTWDKAIDTLGELIKNDQLQKRSLMQKLLTGQSRLPGFHGEWEKKSIKEVFKPVKQKNESGIDRVLTASGEHGLVDQRDYFNRSVSAANLEGYYLLRNGEFAYNRSSMKGYPYGAIKRLDKYHEGVLSTLYICFGMRTNAGFSDYYCHYFEQGILNRSLRKITQVGARAHGLLNLSKGDFFGLKIHCPSVEEQKAIAAHINNIEMIVANEKQQLHMLKLQRKALMRQLLSGQRRVSSY